MSAPYEFTPDARLDLLDIEDYTVREWGDRKAEDYFLGLQACIEAMAGGRAVVRVAFEDRDDIVFRHSQRHYVFALRERDRPLIVIAVLHESMDLLARVRARLLDG